MRILGGRWQLQWQLRWWMRWLLAACLACPLAPAMAHLVTVVSSDNGAAFQEASESLVQELTRNGLARKDIGLVSLAEFQDVPSSPTEGRLIVSLGTEAFRQVSARNAKVAVLAALIPRISFERVLQEASKKSGFNASALYLDQPYGRQLDLLRLALPATRRVGLLWGPESIGQQSQLNAALQARGMEASEGLFSEGRSLIDALRGALAGVDALLAVADSNVYNSSTVANILLTSYRAKTPVLAFSPGYVKAGALLSVHSTATQAGVQVAAMVGYFLQTGNLPANQYPTEFTITTNEYVARSLGLSLDAKVLSERLHKLDRQEKKP
jgi:ABC-type uncharacterized transport system substrate-binding protein